MWIDYQIKGKKIVNPEFIDKLFNFINSNGSQEIKIPNVNILKEYYILNDLEYLVFKIKKKIFF